MSSPISGDFNNINDWVIIPANDPIDDFEDWTIIDNDNNNNKQLDQLLFDDYVYVEKEQKRFECSIVPTLHCADTVEWRKKLIMSAQHNIIISGNYCGGKAFDDVLKLINKQMKKLPDLQVVIIGHPRFIKDQPNVKNNPHENITWINKLKEKYPDRFCFVESPDSYYGTKKITNHTKCTVIDYGKYFIQGGSGIQDNFSLTGVDDQTVDDYLDAERGYSIEKDRKGRPYSLDDLKISQILRTKHQKAYNSNKLIHDDISINSKFKIKKYEDASGNNGLADLFIPKIFRDQDFVFKSLDHKLGKKVCQEALYLAYKWDKHSNRKSIFGKHLPGESWDLNDIIYDYNPSRIIKEYPALSNSSESSQEICSEDNVLYSMLKTPLPDLESIDTFVFEFDHSHRKVDSVFVKMFFTGPEQSESPFEREIIKKINKAENEIIIDQMYFQPTDNLMNAIIEAGKRGVNITIITAGVTKDCSNSQLFFGPRNKYNYHYLVNSLPEELRSNVKVYEFSQKGKGLHKKVLIVDDHLFAGSSNMGYKSLALMGDHEMNFDAKSQELIDKIKEYIVEKDIFYSKRVENPETISVRTKLIAGFHSLGSRIWG